MKKNSTVFLLITLVAFLGLSGNSCSIVDTEKNSGSRIIIEANISKYFYHQLKEIFTIKDNISLRYTPLKYLSSDPPTKYISEYIIDGKVRWEIYSQTPVKVTPPLGTSILMNPGDSVHVEYLGDVPVYSGNKGSTYALLDSLMTTEDRLIKPRKKNSYNATSLTDFMEWNRYLDVQLEQQLPIIEFYKGKISTIEYEYYKSHLVAEIEDDRVKAFGALNDAVNRGYPGFSYTNLINIWDSTQYKPSRLWLQSLPVYYGSVYDYISFMQKEVSRKFKFDLKNDSMNSKEKYTYLLYENAKQRYRGQLRERLMAFVLDEQTLTEMGIKNPMTQVMLKDYYNQPGFPEYKQWVRSLETKSRQLTN